MKKKFLIILIFALFNSNKSYSVELKSNFIAYVAGLSAGLVSQTAKPNQLVESYFVKNAVETVGQLKKTDFGVLNGFRDKILNPLSQQNLSTYSNNILGITSAILAFSIIKSIFSYERDSEENNKTKVIISK